MSKKIRSLKGTRDFYPKDMAIRIWLYDKMREVSEAFGYQEYDGPFLEPIALYAAKSGEELVKEQSFVFPDRSGELIALRPELTPSLVRMLAQRQQQLVFPLRWWSFGPFWRYERPQKGRSREFFQWNVDLIGPKSPEADAELLAIIATFFEKIGLSPNEVIIKVNNRRLLEINYQKLNIPPELMSTVSNWIDRREKLKPEEWISVAEDIGLSSKQVTHLRSMLNDLELWKESEELRILFETLDALGVADYAKYDPNVVRGLDYYTGTVFEAQDVQGDVRRSILGGGRYDDLLAAVGGKPLSGVGFAMGDIVISLILEEHSLIPDNLGKTPASVIVTVFSEGCILESYSLAEDLRNADINTICYPEVKKLGKQFKFADRIDAKIALILGPDEIASGDVSIKNLKTGQQKSVKRAGIIKDVREMLDSIKAS